MKPELWKQAKRIYEEASSAPAEQRARLLDQACGGDGALRAEVEGLLRVAASAAQFLASPPPDAAPAAATPGASSEESAGTVIDRYKLLQQIGEGGFGVVWMAEQLAPVRRRVALKILKLGMDTRQVVARFEAERQALALMDHPNIARVLDGGATASGRPYFVMELVRGLQITDYCDHEQLDTDERIRLFIQVCEAVQHAHQKGVIHRDIKPSNVLVASYDGRPCPKVIDFGIAKATQQPLTEKTLFTEFHQLVGTPAYMAPEQAEMSALDIDTRADIYSLGVLLYEMLTGTKIFDAKELLERGYDEVLRVIREVDPPKPSTRLRTLGETLTPIAARRRSSPKLLPKRLAGDLDWIVMKSIEKERVRRYASASSLAADLELHLRQEPVSASPPSRLYRLRKLARRHRVVVASAVLILASLVIGLSAAVFGLARGRTRTSSAPISSSSRRTATSPLRSGRRESSATRRGWRRSTPTSRGTRHGTRTKLLNGATRASAAGSGTTSGTGPTPACSG